MQGNSTQLDSEQVSKDVDLILWSTRLSGLYRFTHQRFWEKETNDLEYSLRIDGRDSDGNRVPRAESVAEHSWHIADIILIIGPRFPVIDLGKALMHAVLHDKLEIITGDKNPLGKDGKGRNTHAFNLEKKISKDEQEKTAFRSYQKMLNDYSLPIQKEIIEDSFELKSIESRFVKAIDKIHPLTYIIRKKKGQLLDDHILFTLRYSGTCVKYFPEIEPYYNELIDRLITEISTFRKIDKEELKKQFFTEQLNLF